MKKQKDNFLNENPYTKDVLIHLTTFQKPINSIKVVETFKIYTISSKCLYKCSINISSSSNYYFLS